MLYILDTDHVSLLQRGNTQIATHLSRVSVTERAVTVITVAEQLQGWLAVIRRAKRESDAAHGFERLRETLTFYQAVQVLSYGPAAAAEFERLRQQKVRIGTQDLRIASIALSYSAIVVTRNIRDFALVPGLQIVDWSQPLPTA